MGICHGSTGRKGARKHESHDLDFPHDQVNERLLDWLPRPARGRGMNWLNGGNRACGRQPGRNAQLASCPGQSQRYAMSMAIANPG
jgi:hypothetical protein